MRKHLIVFGIALMFSACTTNAENPNAGWQLTMTSPQERWSPGEPIQLDLVAKNITNGPLPRYRWYGDLYLDGKPSPCRDRNAPFVAPPIPDNGGKGSGVTQALPMEPCGSELRLKLILTRECNLLARDLSLIGAHTVSWQESPLYGNRAVSVQLAIVPPIGEDLRAWEQFSERLRDVVSDQSSLSANLVTSFPASTYAVYALAQYYGLGSDTTPLNEERVRIHLAKLQKTGRAELADRTRHFATGPDGKELKNDEGKPISITQEEWLRKMVAQAEQICAGHPELNITEHIRYNVIGSYYVDLLQYGEASRVFEKLAATATNPQIKANSEKMIQLLKEAGLVAN